MRSLLGICVLCLMWVPLLQGCTNSRDIQNLAYVTALGIDYEEGKYKTYVQVLNFSNIARSENTQLGTEVPIWIGKGQGDTLAIALADTNATSQFPLFWGHLKAVVLSENILRIDGKETYSTLNRFYEVRYNVLVYGTREKLPDILTQRSLFNLSPLDTIMYTSMQVRSQSPYILSAYGNRLIANMNEPGNSFYMPSIAINRSTWLEDEKKKGMFELDGAYFFNQGRLVDRMSVDELKGIRWATRKIVRTSLQVPLDEGRKAVISFTHPKLKIRPKVTGSGDVTFDLSVTANGTIRESFNAPIKELEQKAQQAIEDEIRNTYRIALSKKCDPFQLEEALYRQNPRVFHKLSQGGSFFLNEHSLGSLHIKANVTSTGKYKEVVK
jgi:spore germination protein KC